MESMIELPTGTCKECGVEFRMKREDQKFCSSVHRAKWHRRQQARGGPAVELLIAWRVSRGSKKGVLAEIARIVDKWIKEDRRV